MNRNSRHVNVHSADGAPPREAWLFAQAILGRPIARTTAATRLAGADRDQLEWLASGSGTHQGASHCLKSDQAEAKREREQLEWLARISEEHSRKLRILLQEEA